MTSRRAPPTRRRRGRRRRAVRRRRAQLSKWTSAINGAISDNGRLFIAVTDGLGGGGGSSAAARETDGPAAAVASSVVAAGVVEITLELTGETVPQIALVPADRCTIGGATDDAHALVRALAAGRAPPGGFCYPGPAGAVALPPPLVPDEKGYVDFGTKLRFTVDVAACTVAVAVNGFTQEIGSTSIRTPARLVVVGSDMGVRLLSVESARPSLGFAAAAAPAKEAAPPVDTRTTAERLQGTWMVHHLSGTELTTGECSQQSTGLWIVDGVHATFPLQNDRTFDVVTAADGSVTLERTAEGYKAALKVFHDSGNHVEWDGGAHWTRLDGKWSVADDSVGTFGGKTSVEVYGGAGSFAVGSTDKSIEWHTEKPDCTVCQLQYGEVSGWRAMTVELAATSAGVASQRWKSSRLDGSRA